MIDPVSVAALRACISPYSRAYFWIVPCSTTYGCGGADMVSTSPSWHGKTEGDRGCDLSHPVLLLLSRNDHDVVPPQSVVPVRI